MEPMEVADVVNDEAEREAWWTALLDDGPKP